MNYNVLTKCAWLSRIVYHKKPFHGHPDFPFVDNKETDTQFLVFDDNDDKYIVFRGTEKESLNDWITNLTFHKSPCPLGECHTGFMSDVKSVWSDLVYYYLTNRKEGSKVYFTGHSQGAADALIAFALLAPFAPPDAFIGFGTPRVFDYTASVNIGKQYGNRIFYVVNNNDIVTRVPPRMMHFRHVQGAQMYYLKEDGTLSVNPSEWEKFKDRIHGRFDDIGEWGSDGFKDHSISEYMQVLRIIEFNSLIQEDLGID